MISFSQVVKRARWHSEGKTCGAVLEGLEGIPPADEEIFVRLEAVQHQDTPPDNPFGKGFC
jgi:hypothetical protein